MSCDNSVLISSMVDVWNATGNYKVAISMDVTDTSSASNSRLLDLLVGGGSKFAVDKTGIVQTASTGLWVKNTSDHGFGSTGLLPSIYISGNPIISFNNTSLYPINSFSYDVGSPTNLFRNIYQTTHSNTTPSSTEYPSSGAWGIHNDTNSDTRYLAFNNGTGIETIEFGGNDFTGVVVDGVTITGDGLTYPLSSVSYSLSAYDEGSLISSSVTGIDIVGSAAVANMVGDILTITITGVGGGGGGSGMPLIVQDEGVQSHPDVGTINFVGSGVSATSSGNVIHVTVPGPTGVWVDGSSITGDGKNSPLVATANSFVGVLVDGTTIQGNGLNSSLVATANSFTGIIIDNTLTGNGLDSVVGINPSVTGDFLTSLLIDGSTITGDGVTTALVATANSFTGTLTDGSTITGDGYNTVLGIPQSATGSFLTSLLIDGSTITGDGITTSLVATANSFTGVLVDGSTITGDGLNTQLVSTANSFTGVLVDGTSVTGDGLNSVLGSRTLWSVATGTSTVNPGNYILDSSVTGFTLSLTSGVVGEWEFSDAGYNAGSNNVTIGSSSQTFTNESGIQVAGPYIIDVASAYLKIVNTDGSNNYYVASESNSSYFEQGLDADDVTIGGDGVTIPFYYIPQQNTTVVGKDEGVAFATGVNEINFIGAGVDAGSVSSGIWTVVIPGGSGGGGGGSSIQIYDEGLSVHTGITSIDFVGSGVTATGVGPAVTVTIPSITTGPTITGNGINNPFNIPVSSDPNNILTVATGDGQLYVESGVYFTGVLVDGVSITGNGFDTQLVATANSYTGTLVDGTTITGDGINSQLVATANSFTGVLIDGVTITGDGINSELVATANSFTGVLVDGITITGDGINTALGSIPSGSIVNPNYYYGTTASGFSASSTDLFFGDASYSEDDPFSMSDGTGTLTIPTNGRYAIDVEGSMSNSVSGTIVQLRKNGAAIATTTLQDFGNDDVASFGLTYEGAFTASDTLDVRKNNAGTLYNGMMLRVRELVTTASFLSHSGNQITIYNQGSQIATSVDSIDFTGAGVTASAIGNNITVTITGGIGAVTENFALNDLTLDGARTHDIDGNALYIQNNNSATNPTIRIRPSGDVGLTMDGLNQIFGNASDVFVELDQATQSTEITSANTRFYPFDGSAQPIRLYDNGGSNYVSLEGAASITTHTYILPSAQGSSNTILKNNGAGVLSWGVDNSFASADLTLDGARSHELNGNSLSISNTGASTTIDMFYNSDAGIRLKNTEQTLGSIDSTGVKVSVLPVVNNIALFASNISLVNNDSSLPNSPSLRFYNNDTTNYTAFAASTGIISNTSYTLPSGLPDSQDDGLLSCDENGILSWTNQLLVDGVTITGDGINTALVAVSGGNTHFANSDLIFNANRSHELNGNDLSISNTGSSANIDIFYNTGEGIRLNSTEQTIGNLSATGVRLCALSNVNNIVAMTDSFSIHSNESGSGPSPQLRFYNKPGSKYISLSAPTGVESATSTYTLPSHSPDNHGQLLASDEDGAMYWTDAAGAGKWIPADLVESTGVHIDLGSKFRHRTVDLLGSSQTPTLNFTGTFDPVSGTAEIALEITHPSSNVLVISSTNDPGSSFTQPIHDPYIVMFIVDSNGIPKYKGIA